LASLSNDSNGTKRIQFIDGDGERRTIRLGKLNAKAAETVLRRVEQLAAHRIAGTAHEPDLSAWLAAVPAKLYGRLVRVGLAAPRAEDEAVPEVTLSMLCDAFTNRARGVVKPSTEKSYKQTLDALKEFCGPEKSLTAITVQLADEWRSWIASDTKGASGRPRKRLTADNRLSKATVAKRIHVAKCLFGRAVEWGWLPKNPFAHLKPGSQANPQNQRYVDLETIAAVIEACPNVEWKAAIGLCRYAGLRCPSDVAAVEWRDVNWEKGRLIVRGPKNERHEGKEARVVPIIPELRAILEDAFGQAEEGATAVVPMASRRGSKTNLRTGLLRIIAKAGVSPWPRLFHNLRASIDNDLAERFPVHVVAKWIGQSTKVAAEHYLMVRDHHFDAAVLTGLAGIWSGGAESGAPAAQKAAQQPPATAGNEPQAGTTIPGNRGENSVSPAAGENRRKGKVGDIGLEPMTPSLSS